MGVVEYGNNCAIILAFFFGYAFSIAPLLRGGLTVRKAIGIALAADTVSIATMEVVDNAVVLAIPGAMDASLGDALFWASLALALAIAFVVTVPVNRALIVRGKGHAVVHHLHHCGQIPLLQAEVAALVRGSGIRARRQTPLAAHRDRR